MLKGYFQRPGGCRRRYCIHTPTQSLPSLDSFTFIYTFTSFIQTTNPPSYTYTLHKNTDTFAHKIVGLTIIESYTIYHIIRFAYFYFFCSHREQKVATVTGPAG